MDLAGGFCFRENAILARPGVSARAAVQIMFGREHDRLQRLVQAPVAKAGAHRLVFARIRLFMADCLEAQAHAAVERTGGLRQHSTPLHHIARGADEVVLDDLGKYLLYRNEPEVVVVTVIVQGHLVVEPDRHTTHHRGITHPLGPELGEAQVHFAPAMGVGRNGHRGAGPVVRALGGAGALGRGQVHFHRGGGFGPADQRNASLGLDRDANLQLLGDAPGEGVAQPLLQADGVLDDLAAIVDRVVLAQQRAATVTLGIAGIHKVLGRGHIGLVLHVALGVFVPGVLGAFGEPASGAVLRRFPAAPGIGDRIDIDHGKPPCVYWLITFQLGIFCYFAQAARPFAASHQDVRNNGARTINLDSSSVACRAIRTPGTAGCPEEAAVTDDWATIASASSRSRMIRGVGKTEKPARPRL